MRKQSELAAATLASFILMIGGCGSGDDADSTHDHDEHAGHSHDEHDEHTDAAELTEDTDTPSIVGLAEMVEDVDVGGLGLSLDDGKKWLMDDHTRTSISQLNEIVDGVQLDSLESAVAIGVELKEAIANLIKGCTMEGPAHNMLHGFLGKFMPKINALADATELEAAQPLLAEIQAMLAGYADIFE